MSIQTVDSLNIGRYTALAAAKSAVGRGTPAFNRAHNRAKAVFLCEARPHLRIMVGRAGQPQGWPGSLLTGSSTPVRLTTLERGTSGGELSLLPTEAAIMATIPAETHPKHAYHTSSDLISYAALTSSLVDCARYLAMSGDDEAQPHITDLLIIASQRTNELLSLLESAEVAR